MTDEERVKEETRIGTLGIIVVSVILPITIICLFFLFLSWIK